MRSASTTEKCPAQSDRPFTISAITRPAFAGAGMGRRKSTTPHAAGSLSRHASSPKSLSNVKRECGLPPAHGPAHPGRHSPARRGGPRQRRGRSGVARPLSTITRKRRIPNVPGNLARLLLPSAVAARATRRPARPKVAPQKRRAAPEPPDHAQPSVPRRNASGPRSCQRAASSRSRFPRFYRSRNNHGVARNILVCQQAHGPVAQAPARG